MIIIYKVIDWFLVNLADGLYYSSNFIYDLVFDLRKHYYWKR